MKCAGTLLALLVTLSVAGLSHAQQPQPQAQPSSTRNTTLRPPSSRVADDAWAARPLTARHKNLQLLIGPTSRQALSLYQRAEFGLDIHRLSKGDIHDTGKSNVAVFRPVGIAYGVTDNFEIGTAIPVQLKPGDFQNIPIWLTYRFMDGPFQMGAQLAVAMPINAPMELQLGLPMQLHTGILRLDTGFYAVLTFTDPVATTLRVPVRLGFQVSPQIYTGLQTGISLAIEKDRGRDESFVTANMPLYAFLGYTLAGKKGPIDIAFRFGFDRFVHGGRGAGATVSAQEFSFAMGANLTFEL